MAKRQPKRPPWSERSRIANFPAIAKLGITEEELNALTFQGFVCQDRRGDKIYYKLRFRLGGNQHVRYIGNLDIARAVEAELLVLQQDVKHRQQLTALARAGSHQLRHAKQVLQPLLEIQGFHFHGQSIRKRRVAKNHAC